jgi:hypothetical protein
MNRWLLRPTVLRALAIAVFVAIALFQMPWSPAASSHFVDLVGAPPFDERPAGYSVSAVMEGFRRLGPEGLVHYKAYRVLDFVFPWLLCALVAAVMLRIDAARATMWPWIAAVVDTAENVAQVAILATRTDPAPELVQWASFLTQAKFVAYAVMLLMLLAVGVRYVRRQRRAGR